MTEIHRILAHLSDSAQSRQVLTCAVALAEALGAEVQAVHAVEPLHLGAYLSPEAAMTAAQLSQDAERERLARAREWVAEAARSGRRTIDLLTPDAEPLDAMLALSRVSDLVVAGRPTDDDRGGLSRRFASRLLVGAGCPVVFVPGAADAIGCGRCILLAWSATRESARALRDALPLLRRASKVELLRMGEPAALADEPLDAVVAHLARHGVKATASVGALRAIPFSERMLTPTVVDASVAELLLSHAADIGADLIVMGGYGHTRAFELVLGGVTRTMIGTTTVPVLMSH